MITAYARKEGRITATSLSKGQPLPADTVWVDMLDPENNERQFVGHALGIELPTLTDMQEIESSSRLYIDGNATFTTFDVVVGSQTPEPELDALLIATTPSCLVTLRYSEPHAIETFINRIKQQPELFQTVEDGLLALLDTITDRIADILEILARDVELLSRQIFHCGERKKEKRLQDILHNLGQAGTKTHKIRDSINSVTRLMGFLGPRLMPRLNADQKTKFQAVEHDIASLAEHAQFVTQETSFLLDATLGQINVEQNNILKIMSVVMVAFTPPTFFASMWGMNFHNMPEYGWDFGYPLAWAVMLISAIIPLIYFKKRGWY